MGSRLYKLKYISLPANLSIFIIYVYSISTIRSLYFLKLLKYQLLNLRIFKVVLIQPSIKNASQHFKSLKQITVIGE